MSQIKLSKWLKFTIIMVAVCGGIVYLYILPFWGNEFVANNPELKNHYWPWLIFIWITGIPCYIALLYGYKITNEIKKDNSFSEKNARLLKRIAFLAAGDSIFFFIGNIIFMALDMSHPGIVLLSLFISFIGGAIAVAAASLSYLAYKSAQMCEESKLTI